MSSEMKPLSRLLILLVLSFPLQGCIVAVAWMGAVGVDNVRRSQIEFHPFENSWLAPPEMEQERAPFTSIAVTPFPDNTSMAERWTALLQRTTDLRVVGPSEVVRQVDANALAKLTKTKDDRSAVDLAQQIGEALRVDSVLFGRIVEEQQGTDLGGFRDKREGRLYLYLARADGTLLWKDELPFTLMQGGKGLDKVDEDWARRTMMSHVMEHVRKLGLADRGLPFKSTEPAS